MLEQTLNAWRITGRRYRDYLDERVRQAEADDVDELYQAVVYEIEMYRHCACIPSRWSLQQLFSSEAYQRYGLEIASAWSRALILITCLESYWDDVVSRRPLCNPMLLQGFHPDAAVESTAWIERLSTHWKEDIDL